jgi:SpoVK/Ycf46/Vps4 family AAA+-type ATPase
VLLFDEADSLFGKRTEVSSSNDRYANLETNHLLQLIEHHTGITVLTTNRLKGVDEAFLRRIQFRVEFPFPDADMRARLWREMFTGQVPLADDLDFAELGRRFDLSGGHIKAAAVRAIFAAAARDQAVDMRGLCDAAQLEYQGLGKVISA